MMGTQTMLPPVLAPSSDRVRPGWLERRARAMVLGSLARMADGQLHFSDSLGEAVFGDQQATPSMRAAVQVHDLAFFRRLLMGGSIAAGETYMDGLWTCDDLPALLRMVLRNASAFAGLDGLWSWFAGWIHKIQHRWRSNTRTGSRQNIADHYDLGNEFYRLFLDANLMYSCAIFERPDATLEEASFAKNERICRQLKLAPQDHLLEIGTGWGGFALHAARRFGCRVTTTTISRQQYELARQRIAQAGMADRVTVLQQDYRDLRGRYDKLVSIEMIEAVGREFLPEFFQVCSRLLKPEGAMMLQAITIADQHYARYCRSADFIQRYVFPGSHLPSVTAICDCLTRRTDLRVHNLADFTSSYGETLRRWRGRFMAKLDQVRALGYSERFLRMWEYYLCYCEAGFEERNTGLVQMLLTKPGWRPGDRGSFEPWPVEIPRVQRG